jgi:uncharacterized protein YciI
MKNPISIFIMIFMVGITVWSCQPTATENEKSAKITADVNASEEVKYDSALAVEFGADQYGMKKYVMAFLKRGPNRDRDSAEAVALQRAHLLNIERMAEEGMLVVAGPFLDNDDLRGIYIFNVPTVEEAIQLTNTDPAIQAGSLVMEMKEWYGSAGLMGVNDLHKKVSRQSVAE